jgi:hypothetical protein
MNGRCQPCVINSRFRAARVNKRWQTPGYDIMNGRCQLNHEQANH